MELSVKIWFWILLSLAIGAVSALLYSLIDRNGTGWNNGDDGATEMSGFTFGHTFGVLDSPLGT